MEYFFNKYQEFIENDDRRDRSVSPIISETFSNRHEVALPQELIEGKTILDLGSCLGATGHWCLAHGAKYYVGVEAQSEAVSKSKELLSNYWKDEQYYISQSDFNAYLDECIEDGLKFDIVVAFGVIYGHVDYYSFLRKITKVADKYIIADCRYPKLTSLKDKVVELNDSQFVHAQGSQTLNFVGAGSRISPDALRLVMQTLGWDNKGRLIYPEAVPNSNDIDMYLTLLEYPRSINLPTRYLTRFEKADDVVASASDVVAVNDTETFVNDERKPTKAALETSPWEFDESVAVRFQDEARNHIPDYHSVIELCYNLVNDAFPDVKDIKILDVGSALGYTVDYFIKSGYVKTYGVEKSAAMATRSAHPRHIFQSDVLPINSKWDVVLANWTLHFIKSRYEYLRDIYQNLNPGGLFIMTDKMDHSNQLELMYYEFKKRNGVSSEEIEQKREALQGILVTKPIEWYIDTLEGLGFTNIEVVNSRYMFYTIYARKPS